jgi:hypothetical protein
MSIGPASRRSAARKSSQVLASLEALENRQMLSVDLLGSGAFFIPSVTSFVVGGETEASYGLSNGGNTDYNSGAKVSFYLSSDTTFDNADTLLATKSMPKIRANSIVLKPQFVDLKFPEGVTGTFRILTVVDSTSKIEESNENNNVSPSIAFSLDSPTNDLSAAFGQVTLPPGIITGDPAKGKANINVTNAGNSPIPAGAKVDIQVKARPTGAIDGSQDILIGGLTGAKVAKLANGKSKTFKVNVQLPENLAAGTYKLVTVVDSGNALTETNENNNTAESTPAYSLTAASAFTDLSVELASTDVTGTAVTASEADGAVVLRNNGNIALAGSVKVEFFAAPVSNLNSTTSLGSATFNVKLKPGAATKALKVPLVIAESLTVASHNFTAVISNFTGYTDSSAPNNKRSAGDNISVAKGLGVLGKLNSSITFTRTQVDISSNPLLGTVTIETGDFNDNNGRRGTFSWTTFSSSRASDFGNLVFTDTFNADENVVIRLSSKSRPVSINGKTIVFKKPGSSGDGTFLGLVLSYGGKLQKGVYDVL